MAHHSIKPVLAAALAGFGLAGCVYADPLAPGPVYAAPPPPVVVAPPPPPPAVIVRPAPVRRAWVPGHYNRWGRWIPGHWR